MRRGQVPALATSAGPRRPNPDMACANPPPVGGAGAKGAAGGEKTWLVPRCWEGRVEVGEAE